MQQQADETRTINTPPEQNALKAALGYLLGFSISVAM
jgi:hypothetical protein